MSPDPTTLALKQSSDGQNKEGMKDGGKEEEDEWTTPMIIMLIVLIVVGIIALLALGLVVVSNSYFTSTVNLLFMATILRGHLSFTTIFKIYFLV